MRAWVRKRIDAAHARTVQLRSGGSITLSTTLNPLKASPEELAFVSDLAAKLDFYEQQNADAETGTADDQMPAATVEAMRAHVGPESTAEFIARAIAEACADKRRGMPNG